MPTQDEWEQQARTLLDSVTGDAAEQQLSILRGIGYAILSLRGSDVEVAELIAPHSPGLKS
jgi:hypothetical protein